MAADRVAVARPRNRADDRAAFARAWRAPVDRKARLAAWLRMRSNADMIGSIRMSHCDWSKSSRIQKGIGPPRGTGQTVKLRASLPGAFTRRALALHIANPAPVRNERTQGPPRCRTHQRGAPHCLFHFVPSDQSIEWSGRMMPVELKVAPALIVVLLVNVASANSPLSPLICSLLPD